MVINTGVKCKSSSQEKNNTSSHEATVSSLGLENQSFSSLGIRLQSLVLWIAAWWLSHLNKQGWP